MLDPASLLSCALVNKSWMWYVRSHPELRSRVRRHLRRIRKERAEPLNVRIRRAPNGQHPRPPAPFAPTCNETYEMRTIRSNRVSSPVRKHEPVVITKNGQSLMKVTLRKAKKVTRNAMSNVLGLPATTVSPSSTRSSANDCRIGRPKSTAKRILRI